MRNTLVAILFFCFFSVSYAEVFVQPLPADKAFTLTPSINKDDQLVLKWHIAPGYYLYRNEMTFSLVPSSETKISTISLPVGKPKKDEIRGAYQAYTGEITIPITLTMPAKGKLELNIRYQGCSSAGFCYPPIKKYLDVNLSTITVPQEDLSKDLSTVSWRTTPAPASVTDQSYVTQLLSSHHLVTMVFVFLLLGLLLAFTPCVLPMVPILSGIIVGFGKNISTRKAFALSFSYVIGMALTYAAAGVVVASMGGSVQVALQKPAVIIVFSGVFILLALSLFGFYDLTLPRSWHQRLVHQSNRQTSGSYLGVFFMGCLSTLIVSPCVSAPLVGVLTYIAKTGDMVLGGLALLALGLGMGIPLLLFGTTAGKLLPKAGPWMNTVKQIFGLMMLALAIWMLGRVVSNHIQLFLWSGLAILAAIFVWRVEHSKDILQKFHQGLGLVILSYGFILLGGAISGQSDPLYILEMGASHLTAAQKSPFLTVKNMDQFDAELALAKSENKQVMLDFYADWCESCVIMEHHVFNQPSVLNAMSNFVLLRADVTHNNAFDQALLKRYQVIAPPTILFFNAAGENVSDSEVIGEVNAKEFITDIGHVHYDQPVKYCKANTRDC